VTSLRPPSASLWLPVLVSLLSIGPGCGDAPGAEGVDAGAAVLPDAGAPADDAGPATPIDGGSPGDGTDDGGPPAPVPLPAPRSASNPTAKGIWIWHLDALGASADEVAQRCADDGIGYVLIKSGQDGHFWDQEFNASLVASFTGRGVAVYAWAYMTPSGLDEGAVAAALNALAIPGVVGLILDVEAEFEGAADAIAEGLCNQIRAGAPSSIFLGYTSFGWVADHPTFPYASFDRTCGDGFFPQIYWSDRGIDAIRGYTQAIQMIGAAGLAAPVWPIQSNDVDPRNGDFPSTADLNGFFDQAGPLASLWEFPHADRPALIDQLAMLHWRNP
jgi:hypothetical protein